MQRFVNGLVRRVGEVKDYFTKGQEGDYVRELMHIIASDEAFDKYQVMAANGEMQKIDEDFTRRLVNWIIVQQKTKVSSECTYFVANHPDQDFGFKITDAEIQILKFNNLLPNNSYYERALLPMTLSDNYLEIIITRAAFILGMQTFDMNLSEIALFIQMRLKGISDSVSSLELDMNDIYLNFSDGDKTFQGVLYERRPIPELMSEASEG